MDDLCSLLVFSIVIYPCGHWRSPNKKNIYVIRYIPYIILSKTSRHPQIRSRWAAGHGRPPPRQSQRHAKHLASCAAAPQSWHLWPGSDLRRCFDVLKLGPSHAKPWRIMGPPFLNRLIFRHILGARAA